MPLTDTTIRSAKPKEKTFKLFDSGGLYLEVNPGGGKWWRWKYRFGGKEKRLSFGVYPDVSLKSARERRDASRKQLAAGIDPGEARKAEKVAQAGAESFEAIAREWHTKFSPSWVASHGDRILRRLERDIFPWIGKRPIAEIKAPELLAVLRGSRAGGRWKQPIERCRTAGKCFDTPWRQAGRSAILLETFVVHCPHPTKRTTLRLLNLSELPNCSAPLIRIKASSRQSVRCDWRL